MWYRIDFIKLVFQLLPPILRSRFLTALLGVLIVPLRYLYVKFYLLKEKVDNRLDITGNVQYLEKALNDAFFLKNGQIYIETPEEGCSWMFHFEREVQSPQYLYLYGSGDGMPIYRTGESSLKVNFVVMVPTFLCSDLDKNLDVYGGANISIIRKILNIYKPAGRTFSIELYDYE